MVLKPVADLKSALGLGAPKPRYPDVAACLVVDNRSGEVVHHEVFRSGHLAAQRVADRLLGRQRALARQYPAPRYTVDHGVFGTPAALLAVYPELTQKVGAPLEGPQSPEGPS